MEKTNIYIYIHTLDTLGPNLFTGNGKLTQSKHLQDSAEIYHDFTHVPWIMQKYRWEMYRCH